MKNNSTYYPFQHLTSFYFTAPDGTRLAADLVFPAEEAGKAAKGPFPVILIVSRNGRYEPINGNGDMFASSLIPRGYVCAVLELRGCGASFGTSDSFASLTDRKDAAAFIDWLASQEWCTGKVGMVGISNRAFIQLAVACEKPEALKVITPTVAITDFYYQNYPNGVSAMPHLSSRVTPKKMSKEEFLKKVRPVDDDPEGEEAYRAYCQDQFGKNKFFVGNLLYDNMLRDTENPNLGGEKTNLTIPPRTYLDQLKSSGIRQHQFIGQLESGTLGQLANYLDMGGSFVLGPWTHFQSRFGNPDVPEGMFPFNDAYLKIMDHDLKGLDNGLDDLPPALYYAFHTKDETHWRVSDTWPLETERRAKLYLSPERSGSVPSVNDGSLSLQKPLEQSHTDYRVDTSISVFDNQDGKGSTYNRMTMFWDGDMTTEVDKKGLTFTSLPLFPVYETLMAGCVSVDLWVTSTAKDGDFLAYFEEVLPDGSSHYIKDGAIRASHRISGSNPSWETLGATWHTSMSKDVDQCLKEGMDQPVHLQFAIEPIVYQFARGSRLRLTITCADCHTYQHPMYEEELPTISLYQGGEYASFISIPFVEHEENVYNGHVTSENYDGPGTLYFFEKNVYLQTGENWKKLSVDAKEADYVVRGLDAHFINAAFTFRAEGDPIKDGILQHYKGGDKTKEPLPAFRHLYLDQVEIKPSRHHLFLPTVKTLKMDIFRPDPDHTLNPAVFYIHGYGSSYSVLPEQPRDLYDHGYTIVGIDLRNYPSNPFPDYIHDVKGAIRYIRTHADSFSIDPDRLGCYGLSLGGNSTLMAAVTASESELEGSVGGNLGASSRLQAAAAGFAWSDLLHMGSDIAIDFQDRPDLLERKKARTDGEFAPCAEAIDFTGKGKGIANLRRYKEEGRQGSDPEFDSKLGEAIYASPNSHIGPDCPPMALFGGYGADTVDISIHQSLKTFRKMHENDIPCLFLGNTQGNYGRTPEAVHAITEFFNHWLLETNTKRKIVVSINAQRPLLLANAKEVSEEHHIQRDLTELRFSSAFLRQALDLPDQEFDGYDTYISLYELENSKSIRIRRFESAGMITLSRI